MSKLYDIRIDGSELTRLCKKLSEINLILKSILDKNDDLWRPASMIPDKSKYDWVLVKIRDIPYGSMELPFEVVAWKPIPV